MTVAYKGPKPFERLCWDHEVHMYERVIGLTLWGPKYDDARLDELYRLRHLEHLQLTDTQISATALGELRRRLPNCQIQVNSPQGIGQGV